ncbi:hypothetical protein H2198_009647 [Neophaeococcomyces mojaviensis]|uniref:Uncharacterized protein n=1 Tax=Neophaeococcomyces mojaviensis TaxID=3383035 RepID=A0ACC2ZU33_9EURO|nr:hypothetical protein H2198_009647 [Knufia sp. JES_112]
MDIPGADQPNVYHSVAVSDNATAIVGNNYGNIVHNIAQAQFVLDGIPNDLVAEICNAVLLQIRRTNGYYLHVSPYTGKYRLADNNSDGDGCGIFRGTRRKKRQHGHLDSTRTAVRESVGPYHKYRRTRLSGQAQSIVRHRQRHTPTMPGRLDALPYINVLNGLKRGIDAYVACLLLYTDDNVLFSHDEHLSITAWAKWFETLIIIEAGCMGLAKREIRNALELTQEAFSRPTFSLLLTLLMFPSAPKSFDQRVTTFCLNLIRKLHGVRLNNVDPLSFIIDLCLQSSAVEGWQPFLWHYMLDKMSEAFTQHPLSELDFDSQNFRYRIALELLHRTEDYQGYRCRSSEFLQLCTVWFGPKSFRANSARHELAKAECELGNTQRAIELFNEVRFTYTANVFHLNEVLRCQATYRLARIHAEEGDKETALHLFRVAFEWIFEVCGPTDDFVLRMLHNLVVNLEANAKFQDVVQLRAQYLDSFEILDGSDTDNAEDFKSDSEIFEEDFGKQNDICPYKSDDHRADALANEQSDDTTYTDIWEGFDDENGGETGENCNGRSKDLLSNNPDEKTWKRHIAIEDGRYTLWQLSLALCSY